MSELEGLYGDDFEDYFNKLDIVYPHFMGVTSIDKIPTRFPIRHFLIVNLSPSGTPGSHWVVIVRSNKNLIEIFNSLGCDDLEPIKSHLSFRFTAEIEFNNTALQMATSTSCGLYCIYFAIHRVLNFDQAFEETLSDYFVENLAANENKVAQFCKHLKQLKPGDDESFLFDLLDAKGHLFGASRRANKPVLSSCSVPCLW